jgi:hypothetical protein
MLLCPCNGQVPNSGSPDFRVWNQYRSEGLVHVTRRRRNIWSEINHLCLFAAPVVPQPQCTVDADCASKLACFSGTCRNPCIETKPCAQMLLVLWWIHCLLEQWHVVVCQALSEMQMLNANQVCFLSTKCCFCVKVNMLLSLC